MSAKYRIHRSTAGENSHIRMELIIAVRREAMLSRVCIYSSSSIWYILGWLIVFNPPAVLLAIYLSICRICQRCLRAVQWSGAEWWMNDKMPAVDSTWLIGLLYYHYTTPSLIHLTKLQSTGSSSIQKSGIAYPLLSLSRIINSTKPAILSLVGWSASLSLW